MKYIPILLLLLAPALRGQVPHIDYMMADEAKSQLQIHGTFASDTTGSVTIENIKQTVRLWSDTLIICDLPDSGAGSGGHVSVSQMSGTSNVRMLSIFEISVAHSEWYKANGGNSPQDYYTWYIVWRIDLRTQNSDSLRKFEIGKVSNGGAWDPVTSNTINEYWVDSTNYKSPGISVSGTINISSFMIQLSTVVINFGHPFGAFGFSSDSYHPKVFTFDTLGNVFGYTDMIDLRGGQQTIENQISGKILYPPSIKNAVTQSPQPSSNLIKIFSHISSEGHLISLEAETPLGEMTASLYSIDGRLLKQEKILIPSAGMYYFDASGINTHFGFLVLKTEKGIVAGKVLF